MNKYYRLMQDLEEKGEGIMTCFGSSMMPIFKTKQTMLFKKFDRYEIGDCVFCKVNGRFIDCHLIIKKNKNKGYLISNNHNHINGWTRKIYGKVVKILK